MPSLGTRQLLKTSKQDRRYSEGFLLRTKTTPPRIRQQGERHGTKALGGFKPLPYRGVVNSSKNQHEKATTELTSPKSSVGILIFITTIWICGPFSLQFTRTQHWNGICDIKLPGGVMPPFHRGVVKPKQDDQTIQVSKGCP